MLSLEKSERAMEALQRAHRHWATPKETGGEAPDVTVAISREAGALGSEVAGKVGDLLGWPVYDRELLELIANKKGLRVQLLESVDERKVHWLRECMETFGGVPRVSEDAYVSYLVETLYSLAALGRCVIVGRGAPHLLPPERTVRVRLIGPRQDRVRVMREQLHVPAEEAARWVERTDRERHAFVRSHFHRDVADPLAYDLTLDVFRLTVAGAAGVIVQAVRQVRQPREAAAASG